MVDTLRTEAALLALMPVGGQREIGAQDLRDFVYSIYRSFGITFTDPGADPSHVPGHTYYRDGTLNVMRDVAGVIANMPEETQTPLATNNTGTSISNGKAVYISGALSQKPTLALATNADATAEKMIAVATHDIADTTNGYATTFGMVRGLDTSAWAEGTELFLGTAGNLVSTRPALPTRVVSVAYVIRQDSSEGEILVNIRRIRDQVKYGGLWFSTPALTTLSVNTWTKALGTTTIEFMSEFDADSVNNRLRHTDPITDIFEVDFDGSMTCAGNNQIIWLGLSKGGADPIEATWTQRKVGTGSDVGAGGASWFIEMAQNEYAELWVRNTTSGAGITIENGRLKAKRLG